SRHQVLYRSVDGEIRTYAGTGEAGSAGDGGPASAAELERPTSLAVAPDGTLYIADQGANRIRAVEPGASISTVTNDVFGATSIAVGPNHALYVVRNEGVYVINGGAPTLLIPSGPSRLSVGGQVEAFFPSAIAVATNGDLWVSGLSPKQLMRFDTEGNLLEACDCIYVSPGGGLAAHPDGRVIVADYGWYSVDAFS